MTNTASQNIPTTSQRLSGGVHFPDGFEIIDRTGVTRNQNEYGKGLKTRNSRRRAASTPPHRIATPFHHAHDTVCPQVPAMSASLWPGLGLKYATFTKVQCGKLAAYTPQPHCAKRTRGSEKIYSPSAKIVSHLHLLLLRPWFPRYRWCRIFFFFFCVAHPVRSSLARVWDARLQEASACSLWEELPMCDGKQFDRDW